MTDVAGTSDSRHILGSPIINLDVFRELLSRAFLRDTPAEDEYGIRTCRSCSDTPTSVPTMVYTHVLDRGPPAVRSPVDSL